MSKKDWDTFFDLIDKIVEGRGMSADDKAELVVKEAQNRGDRATMNFEEFVAWDFPFPEPDDDEVDSDLD